MGTTADGLPYPEGTDKVVDGDDAIKALASALGGKTTISTPIKLATDVPSIYPMGWSLVSLATPDAATWPIAVASNVITLRMTTTRAIQWQVRTASVLTLPNLLMRTASGDTWTEWYGAAGPVAQATGNTTITAPLINAGSTLVISLPANRFTQPPIVSVTPLSNAYLAGSSGGIPSATSFTARVFAISTAPNGTVTVNWTATQQLLTGTGIAFAGPEDAATRILVCHTDGCGNAEIPIEVYWDPECSGAACGVCGQPITDITEPI